MLGPSSFTTESVQDSAWDAIVNMMLLEGDSEDCNPDNTNDISCILWITLGETSILLLGDSGKNALLKAIKVYEKNHKEETNNKDVDAHIIKVSHHGSKYCSSEELWNKITRTEGTYAIISAGLHKKYGHPHEETLQHILKCGSPVDIYCTNICPARFDQLKLRKVVPLREKGTFEDDSKGAKDPGNIFITDYRCHGDCKFEISYKGKITPVPQFNQGKCWYLKKCNTKENFCFKEYDWICF